MDVLLVLDRLVPNAEYFGICDNNTENQYNKLNWKDNRNKPLWNEICNEWKILNLEILKNNCKEESKKRIAQSDWSVLPDVNITNKSEFESYRSQLRNLILNPVEDANFPVEPNPIWSK